MPTRRSRIAAYLLAAAPAAALAAGMAGAVDIGGGRRDVVKAARAGRTELTP